jgi:hypothetical protein
MIFVLQNVSKTSVQRHSVVIFSDFATQRASQAQHEMTTEPPQKKSAQ